MPRQTQHTARSLPTPQTASPLEQFLVDDWFLLRLSEALSLRACNQLAVAFLEGPSHGENGMLRRLEATVKLRGVKTVGSVAGLTAPALGSFRKLVIISAYQGLSPPVGPWEAVQGPVLIDLINSLEVEAQLMRNLGITRRGQGVRGDFSVLNETSGSSISEWFQLRAVLGKVLDLGSRVRRGWEEVTLGYGQTSSSTTGTTTLGSQFTVNKTSNPLPITAGPTPAPNNIYRSTATDETAIANLIHPPFKFEFPPSFFAPPKPKPESPYPSLPKVQRQPCSYAIWHREYHPGYVKTLETGKLYTPLCSPDHHWRDTGSKPKRGPLQDVPWGTMKPTKKHPGGLQVWRSSCLGNYHMRYWCPATREVSEMDENMKRTIQFVVWGPRLEKDDEEVTHAELEEHEYEMEGPSRKKRRIDERLAGCNVTPQFAPRHAD